MPLKDRVHAVLEAKNPADTVTRAVNFFLLTLISLNVLVFILETVRSVSETASYWFEGFEAFSIAAFSIEYCFRIWACTAAPKYHSPLLGRVRFAVKPMPLVDLCAILPFFLPFVGFDSVVLRALRLFRWFRILKLGRYSKTLLTMGRVLSAKKEELTISVSLVILLLILTSSGMYYAERDAQPDRFSSIPASMWWAVMTLTTVGYGDVYPITGVGRLFGGAVAIIGIGLFALPAGIVGSGFVEEVQKKRNSSRCPHCGREIDT